MSKDAPDIVTESKPKYPPAAGEIFGRETDLLRTTILPAERQRIASLSALMRGDQAGAGSILGPALSAARQAQAKLSAGVSDLPADVAAPIQEEQARQVRQLPTRIQGAAPEELAGMVQSMIGPQFRALFAPGQESLTSGGGPSDFETGLQVAGTVAALAAIGFAI